MYVAKVKPVNWHNSKENQTHEFLAYLWLDVSLISRVENVLIVVSNGFIRLLIKNGLCQNSRRIVFNTWIANF